MDHTTRPTLDDPHTRDRVQADADVSRGSMERFRKLGPAAVRPRIARRIVISCERLGIAPPAPASAPSPPSSPPEASR